MEHRLAQICKINHLTGDFSPSIFSIGEFLEFAGDEQIGAVFYSILLTVKIS